MARLDQEDSKSFNQLLQSGRFSHSRKTLIGDTPITKNGSLANFFDANGSTRIAYLPDLEEGRFYIVGNVGGSNNIEVRTALGGLVTTLLPGDTALVVASDLEWTALRGWAALGVFTNTVNGLVPAPNSVTPGSLFLRDDGQWGQVQVTGIVDAFKFITDGTNTAIGSGPDTFRLRSDSGQVEITVTNGHATFGDTANFEINEAAINHDLLLNFFADEHVGHSTVVLTAGTGLSGGGDITVNRTFNLDLNDLTSDTPVLTDTFAFYDVSEGDTNKATITTLNGILVHNSLSGYVANEHINHTGVSIIAGTGLSGGGDITTSRTLNLNITGLTADTLATGDEFAFYDISGADHNKVTLANLNAALDHNSLLNYVANRHIDHTAVTLTAGAGLTGGGDISASRSFAVGAGTGITVNADDVALDTTNTRNVDHTSVTISTTEGIQGGGDITATRNLKLDINGLTADASPDGANDYIVTYDASATAHKKVLINNLPSSGFNINALTAATPVAADEVPFYDLSATANRKTTFADLILGTKNYLTGLTLSAAGSTATFGIAAGVALDSTNAAVMTLASAYTKTTSAWAVGTANGALDTGTIANGTWYHVHLIKRLDTGVTDILISTSATAPTLPTNYTVFRRIGSMLTDGSAQWVKFSQVGDEFLWDVRRSDLGSTATSTAASLHVLSTPPNVKCWARVMYRMDYASGAGNTAGLVTSPDESDQAATSGTTTSIVGPGGTGLAPVVVDATIDVRTNTASQIRIRASGTGATNQITTYGWRDRRGQDG